MDCALLHELPARAARRFGDRPFLERWRAGGDTLPPISFAEFALWVDCARGQLSDIGVARGQCVAVLAHASVDSLALSLAVPSVGAVLVNLNWRHPVHVLQQLVRLLGCAVMVVGRGLTETARRLTAAVSELQLLLMLEGSESEPGVSSVCETAWSCDPSKVGNRQSSSMGSAQKMNKALDKNMLELASPDDVAVLMFTSGTTALPKAVPLTHRGLLHSCALKEAAEAEVFGLVSPNLSMECGQTAEPSHRGSLAFLPTFHVIGFTNNFVHNLRAGVRCMVFCDAPFVPVSGPLLLRACAALRPSILDTVPALLDAMLPLSAEEAAALRGCEAVLYGGSALRPHSGEALRVAGVRLCSQYGQTELAGMVMLGSHSAPHGCMKPVGGIGCWLEARLGDEDLPRAAEPLESFAASPTERGELVLTCVGSLTPGYWKLEEGEGAFRNSSVKRGDAKLASLEWRTGDLFERTTDGWFRHECRLDELLTLSSGEMVHSLAVERALLGALSKWLTGCCVVGSNRPRPAAMLELCADAPIPSPWSSVEEEAERASASEDEELVALISAVLNALEDVNNKLPTYSRLAPRAVMMLHPARDTMLARGVKGAVARKVVESELATWLDAAFSTAPPRPQDPPLDSLGIAALTSRSMRESEHEHDVLVQHLKVALLFAVLLRHLQRFTVKTCHAWERLPRQHLLVCLANNVLQTGAAEGLAFLSGTALARRRLHARDALAPFVLILLFRHLLHPLLEAIFLYRVDVGTAHLWFVLMVGLGRLLCWPLSRLPSSHTVHVPETLGHTDRNRDCMLASSLRIAAALTLLCWRLGFAPAHIGLSGYPTLRRWVVHNLPLFLLGFISSDVHIVARTYLLPAMRSVDSSLNHAMRRLAPRLASATLSRGGVLCNLLASRLNRCALVMLSFVFDPLIFGVFTRKAKAREILPVMVYTRAALRVAALAALLPRHRTVLTAAGRSQLLAYLLHDAVFAIASQAILPAILPFSKLTSGFSSLSIALGSSPSYSAIVAVLELVAYAAACLSVQLLLSQPISFPPSHLLSRLQHGVRSFERQTRLLWLWMARRAGIGLDKRVSMELASV